MTSGGEQKKDLRMIPFLGSIKRCCLEGYQKPASYRYSGRCRVVYLSSFYHYGGHSVADAGDVDSFSVQNRGNDSISDKIVKGYCYGSAGRLCFLEAVDRG